jgi:hypothetical protein
VATLTVTAAPTSLQGPLPANAISLYHKPARDLLSVRVTLPNAEPIHLSLLDLQGRVLRRKSLERQSLHQHQCHLSVEGLPSGLYFLRIQVPSWQGQQKILGH